MVRLFPREASSASYEGEQASGNFLGTKCFEPIYQVKLLPKTLPFTYQSLYHKQNALGVPPQHVDSSAPTILPQWVRVPSTPSMLLSFIVFVLYWHVKRTKINKKRPGLAHLKNLLDIPCHSQNGLNGQDKKISVIPSHENICSLGFK